MIVGRIAKNSYTWYGRHQLEATLEGLQLRARQQGYHLQMELAAEAKEAALGREDDSGEGDAGNGERPRAGESTPRVEAAAFTSSCVVCSWIQQERQVSAHHEPEVRHALPGLQDADGDSGRGGEGSHRGESGLVEPQPVQK